MSDTPRRMGESAPEVITDCEMRALRIDTACATLFEADHTNGGFPDAHAYGDSRRAALAV